MKDNKKPGQNPDVNTGKSTGTEKNPDVKKSGETKTKGDEVWKDPDPTTPERKIDPDPTKPEKQEGPYSGEKNQGDKKPYADDSNQKKPAGEEQNVANGKQKPADTEKKNPTMKKNPASVESNSDEEIGSLDGQDIDDQGITGESKGDDDFENEDRRKAG